MSLLRRRLDCIYTNKSFYAEGQRRRRDTDEEPDEPPMHTDENPDETEDEFDGYHRWVKRNGQWIRRDREPPK